MGFYSIRLSTDCHSMLVHFIDTQRFLKFKVPSHCQFQKALFNPPRGSKTVIEKLQDEFFFEPAE